MVFCYCIGLLCYCLFFFFFLFFSILGLGWLLCSCSPVLPNFMKTSLKVFQLTHFCWEVLCPAVSSIHFLLPILLFHGSIHDPIHITNLGENDLWRDPFLLSATVSLEISLVAQGTVPGASRYLILLTLRLTAKFHLTWVLQELPLGSNLEYGYIEQHRHRFHASLELNIPICASNNYLLSVYITLRKAIF